MLILRDYQLLRQVTVDKEIVNTLGILDSIPFKRRIGLSSAKTRQMRDSNPASAANIALKRGKRS